MISSILPAILPTVGKLVDKIFPDEEAAKREKLKIEQELLKQLQSVDLAQIEVNKVEIDPKAYTRKLKHPEEDDPEAEVSSLPGYALQ